MIFDLLLSDVQNAIAAEFLSEPMQSTDPINTTDLLSILELENKLPDITASGCENVDQVLVDSLVDSCNKMPLDAASDSDMLFILFLAVNPVHI